MAESGIGGDRQFALLTLVLQAVCVVLFGMFADYGVLLMPGGSYDPAYVNTKYPLFADVHVMIFIGFGFLMTFLRKYGYSSVSLNLLLASFTIEWSILMRGFFSAEFASTRRFSISVDQLLTADFSAAVVLISFGAVLGRLSPTQYMVMTLLEVPASVVTEYYVVQHLKANDAGGSIVIHTFGAYFGLAASRALYRSSWDRNNEHAASVYHSDLFAMVGTLFLWVFWPSFNAAVATREDARHRAIANTVLSLVSCTVVTFLASQFVTKEVC